MYTENMPKEIWRILRKSRICDVLTECWHNAYTDNTQNDTICRLRIHGMKFTYTENKQGAQKLEYLAKSLEKHCLGTTI